jgi:hypothetical protein
MTDQLPAYPLQADVQSDGGRWSLRMERDIPHSPDLVWAALTKADQVRRWAPYAPARDLDVVGDVDLPNPSAEACRRIIGAGTGPRQTGRYCSCCSGAATGVTNSPRPTPGAFIVLTHTFDQREEAPDYASGWHPAQRTPGPDGHDVPAVAGSRPGIRLATLRDNYAELLNNNAQFATRRCCSWPATPKLVSRNCD